MTVTWHHNGQQRQLQTDHDFRETGQDLTDAAHAGCSHWSRRHIRPENQPPGGYQPQPDTYIQPERTNLRWNPAQLTVVIQMYVSAAAQDPGWTNSAAKAFIDTLKDMLLRHLPGYNETQWAVPNIIETRVPSRQD